MATKTTRGMPDASKCGVPLPEEADELPTDKGFLVQLARDTGPTLVPFAGRVEHLASGHRLRFANVAEFRAALTQLLALVKRP